MMKTDDLLTLLEETIAKLNITLEYDDLKKGVVNSLGGYFTHKGKERILVHKTLTPVERIDVIISIIAELEGLDLHKLGLPESIIKNIEDQKVRRAEALAESFVDTEGLDSSTLPEDLPANLDSNIADDNQSTDQTS